MASLKTPIALTTLLISSLWAQRPQQEEVPVGGRDIYGRPIGVEPGDDLLERMQGAWRLVDIQDEYLDGDGRSHRGFMTFSDRFMAVEIHMRWTERNGDVIEDAFQSGIHEIDFLNPARIRTSTLIGSYLDEDEELEWEVTGFGREFDVNVSGDRLVLTRDVGSQLIFQRQHARTGSYADIFGVDQGPKGDTDIFGAPIRTPEPFEVPETEDEEDPVDDPEDDPGDDPDEGEDESEGDGSEDPYRSR